MTKTDEPEMVPLTPEMARAQSDLYNEMKGRIAELVKERGEWESRAHRYEIRLGNLGRDLNAAEARVEKLRAALGRIEREEYDGVASDLIAHDALEADKPTVDPS